MATILQMEQLEPRPFIPTKFGRNPLNSFGATVATNKQTNKHTATMVRSCLYSHDTARIMKQAIELSREQRQIHLNIFSPRVKVRETEVIMPM